MRGRLPFTRALLPLIIAAVLLADGVQAVGAENFVIGLATAQTGYLAPYDQPALSGLRMAVDEINAKGGLLGKDKVVLQIKDTRSDTAATVQATQELVAQGIHLLITPCDADPTIAAGQISQAARIPTFSFCGTTPTVPAAVGDFMFGSTLSDNAEGLVLANYALAQGYRSAYLLVSPDSAYTLGLPRYFGRVFVQHGGKILKEANFSMGQQDFSARVTELKAMRPQPDVIVSSAYEPDFPAFIKQLRSAGVSVPVLEADAIDTPTSLGLGAAADGVVHATGGYPMPGSALEAFYKRYQTLTGKSADSANIAYGYDLGLIIAAAVTAANSTNGSAIRDAITHLKNVPGVVGPITYADTNRMPIVPIYLCEIRGGKRLFLKVETPPTADLPSP
jgi:branched-chain amino acid transport system substrate-binding protein